MVFSVYPDSPDYSTDDYFNGIPTGYFADNHDLTSNSTSMEYFSYTSDRMEHLYLLDFDSGRVIKLNSQNVKKLLITDPSMYNEYLSLPVFDQKEHLFDHIVKFNQKNSLNLASA